MLSFVCRHENGSFFAGLATSILNQNVFWSSSCPNKPLSKVARDLASVQAYGNFVGIRAKFWLDPGLILDVFRPIEAHVLFFKRIFEQLLPVLRLSKRVVNLVYLCSDRDIIHTIFEL